MDKKEKVPVTGYRCSASRSGWTRTYSFKWAWTHSAGALQQKSAPMIIGMHPPGKTDPAAGKSWFGNTKTCYLECMDTQCRSPACRFQCVQ